MDILDLPFNRFIGIEKSPNTEYLLSLNDAEVYKNHLNSVHASAMFALAEASSAYCLSLKFPDLMDQIVPLLRSVQVKFKKPAKGTIRSKAELLNSTTEEVYDVILSKKKIRISVIVSLFDLENNRIFEGEFEWFITKMMS
jgi:acyl-coenzyme A thioesterase PaaI-like protein